MRNTQAEKQATLAIKSHQSNQCRIQLTQNQQTLVSRENKEAKKQNSCCVIS